MFEPPPGYEDMLADAEESIYSSAWVNLDVPKIGTVRARRPMPDGAALLAMAANPKIGHTKQVEFMMRFVNTHVATEDIERVYFAMMMDEMPADSIERLSRAVATWGTARPYTAVVSLAVMTAYHWRTIRHKLLMAGVLDAMNLPSMHALLDVAESMAVESASNDDDPQQAVGGLYRRLYATTPDLVALNGEDYRPVPPGFDPDDVEDAFDAFARAAR